MARGIAGLWCVIQCETCGQEYRRKQWQISRSGGRFCSRRCALTVQAEQHNHWKGGSHIHPNGYRRIRVDGRYEWEHRLIAAEMLGRPLIAAEKVHHLNGDKLDNRPENLHVYTDQSAHMKHHIHDPVWAKAVNDARHRSTPAKSEAMRKRWRENRPAMIASIRRGKGLEDRLD